LADTVVAQGAQGLPLLVPQVEAGCRTAAIALLTLLQFVLLLRFQIIDLTVKNLPYLFARTAGARRCACQNWCERQEETNCEDPTRSPMSAHNRCLLDTNPFHPKWTQAGGFVL
jgi:hypothetical protein